MQNVDEIFSLFANILEANKRPDSPYTNANIDELCSSYSNTLVLWDGAFSYASRIGPSPEDIGMYKCFSTAAVFTLMLL